MPSQWALQYFAPSLGTQLQAGFAHFFGFDMVHLPQSVPNLWAHFGLDALYAGFTLLIG
jgi:hypothetical protein